MDEQALKAAEAAMKELAEAEGFAFDELFVETPWLYTSALEALVEHCNRHDVRHVVVPSTPHLNTVPSLAFIAQVALQEVLGGLVWVAQVTDEEAASIRALLDARPL
ncbi:hypothetical protein ACFZAD_24525 [Streptomyces iakyrus]|uniref:hypothetical protein n=1 Tax=Streptomyces iakyrus TaxID=68219 RepID=UPI0036F177DC